MNRFGAELATVVEVGFVASSIGLPNAIRLKRVFTRRSGQLRHRNTSRRRLAISLPTAEQAGKLLLTISVYTALLLAFAAAPARSDTTVDVTSRAFAALVSALCADGWAELKRLEELGMIDTAYIQKALPVAETQCNTVFGANKPNGVGAFLILKHNAFSPDDVSWSTDRYISNGHYYELARLVARVPRVFALADYYAHAKSTRDEWEPASLVDVTKTWLASGADVNMRTCHGFRLADVLVLATAPNTMELIKRAGADLNYRTPYILKDDSLAFYNRGHSYGNQYSINYKKYGIYFYGREHPSFETTHRNKCVTDQALDRTGLTFIEFFLAYLSRVQFSKKTLLAMLESVVREVDLPPGVVHSVLNQDRMPSHGLRMLDILLGAGADINARNEQGLTLIERVFNSGASTDLLKELQRRGAQL